MVALGGSAVVTASILKATKEIFIKWMETRSKSKITWKDKGGKTITVEGPGSRKILNELFDRLEKDAHAEPPPQKKKSIARPPAQIEHKTPAKKKKKKPTQKR